MSTLAALGVAGEVAVRSATAWLACPAPCFQHHDDLRSGQAWGAGHVQPAVPQAGIPGDRAGVVSGEVTKDKRSPLVVQPAVKLDDKRKLLILQVAEDHSAICSSSSLTGWCWKSVCVLDVSAISVLQG